MSEAKEAALIRVDPDAAPTLGPEIDLFISHVESISDGFMLSLILATQQLREKYVKELEAFESDVCEVEHEGGKRIVSVPSGRHQDWRKLSKRVRNTTLALVNLPRSLLVSLISHYDAYLGRVIRTIYLRKPELLNTSERKLTFEELTKFDSVSAVKEFVIEKEVEAVLRSSHVEQFKFMERMYGLPLTKGLASWPDFIELTERRNLFVHTDGNVSSQYLSVCKKHGCIVPEEVKEGVNLGVPQDYFETSTECVFEIGVKLGHVLWRKLFPNERADADKHLVTLTYELLATQKYRLASKILDFACVELKSYSSEVFKLMLMVNRALAYKWQGDEKSARQAMRGADWTAKGDEFKLANAVIHDDWSSADRFMRRLGDGELVTKENYRHWPLFKEWRKRAEFKAAYLEIFGEDFERAVEVDTAEADEEDGMGPFTDEADARHTQSDQVAQPA